MNFIIFRRVPSAAHTGVGLLWYKFKNNIAESSTSCWCILALSVVLWKNLAFLVARKTDYFVDEFCNILPPAARWYHHKIIIKQVYYNLPLSCMYIKFRLLFFDFTSPEPAVMQLRNYCQLLDSGMYSISHQKLRALLEEVYVVYMALISVQYSCCYGAAIVMPSSFFELPSTAWQIGKYKLCGGFFYSKNYLRFAFIVRFQIFSCIFCHFVR